MLSGPLLWTENEPSPCILIQRGFFPADPPGAPRSPVRLFFSSRMSSHCQPARATRTPLGFGKRRAVRKTRSSLLIWPDHYVLRMLMSAGISLERAWAFGRAMRAAVGAGSARHLAALRGAINHIFRATPSRLLGSKHVFGKLFDLKVRLEPETADFYFDTINAALHTPPFKTPRVIRFLRNRGAGDHRGCPSTLCNITGPSLGLAGKGRVITTFSPGRWSPILRRTDFNDNVRRLAQLTGEDPSSWQGYLARAEKKNARAFFREHGRNGNRSWPPDRGDGGTLTERQAQGFIRACARRARVRPRLNCSAPRC